jgi:biofilm PGA synthesis N-glycosyltransferase PgaC
VQWLSLIPLLGVSLAFWTVIGGLRRVSELPPRRRGGRHLRRRGQGSGRPRLTPADVAVLIPARNEELVIDATISSVLRLVRPGNVHVIADGCDDHTAPIARSYGVHVLEIQPAGGKAAGIETAVRHFDLPARFAVLLLVDADTEVDEHYLDRGLPLFDEQAVVAVAGYARTSWRPADLTLVGRFLVAYRTRLYAVMQWLKYGQTWRWTNLTAIVPGFASMYRTRVLPRLDINPPGLIIEDFNMTFELQHKRLGRIAFRPEVTATTQDPDNLRDYYRQITRWQLGLWQTVRRHGLWPSWFCVALGLFLAEVVLASVALLALAVVLLLAPVVDAGNALLDWGWLTALDRLLDARISVLAIVLFVVLPDYLLTCLAAIGMRQPSLLGYGLGFLPIRMLDAAVMLWTLPKAWWTRSSGMWTSPGRRAAGGSRRKAAPRLPVGRAAPGMAVPDWEPVLPAPRAEPPQSPADAAGGRQRPMA